MNIIDLGLSVLWGDSNLGALSPWEYGNYYAWGETEKKLLYNWETYKFRRKRLLSSPKNSSDLLPGKNEFNPKYEILTKYCSIPLFGHIDNKHQLESCDDVASIVCGKLWHIPTKDEMKELLENCDAIYTTFHGINGCKLTSKINHNSIFLPSSGSKADGEILDFGDSGNYWSSSLGDDGITEAYTIGFNNVCVPPRLAGWTYRFAGLSIRPVRKK